MKLIKPISLLIVVGVVISSLMAASHVLHPAIGEIAPEIAMKSPNGGTKKLTDLRGKVVLIDFWASWCRTCRIENSTYTKAYSKFKDKKFKNGASFDIFSVSLDTDSTSWTRAIANDRMVWDNHVSDFKKWDSPIVTSYSFKFLPHNLVIDQNGKVIAKGLFGNKLDEFLTSQLAE